MKKIQKKFKLYLFIIVSICLSDSCIAQSIEALQAQMDSLDKREEYKTIIPLVEKFVKLIEKKYKKNSDEYIDALIQKSTCYDNIGESSKAIQITKEALLICEKSKKGKKHLTYGILWQKLYVTYSNAKMDKEAICAEDSTFIYLDKNSEDFAILLTDKAKRLSDENKYSEAKQLVLQSIKYWEDKKVEDMYSIRNFIVLGGIIAESESNEKAIPYFQKVIDWTEKNMPYGSFSQIEALNCAMINYDKLGDFGNALICSRKIINCLEKNTEINAFLKLRLLQNHAGALQKNGDIDSTLFFFNKAKNMILNETKETSKQKYAIIANNDGVMFLDAELGDYQKVIELALENLKIIGKDSLNQSYLVDYVLSMNNLSRSYILQKKYDKSKIYLNKLLELYDKEILQNQNSIEMFFNNFSYLYIAQKDLINAEKWYCKTYELQVKSYGVSGTKTLIAKKNISKIRLLQKKYQEAVDFSIESENEINKLNQIDNALSPQLYYIIAAYRGLQQPEKALPYLEKKLLSLHYTFEKIMPIVSEKTRNEQTKSLEDYNGTIYEFAKTYPTYGSTFAYDLALLNKGIVLNYSQNWKKTLENTQDATLKNDFEKWLMCKRFLSRQYQVELSKRSSDTDSIARFAEQLEGNLNRTSKVFQTATATVNWQDVQAKLQEGEVAIEFVDYKYSLETLEGDTVHQYLAILLRKGEQPKVISLYDEKTITKKIGEKILEGSRYTNIKDNLFDLWQPLEPHLQGIKKIYYSPSGLLNRVSFGAIAYDKDKYLSDKYEFRLLRSTRELVVSNVTTTNVVEVLNLNDVKKGKQTHLIIGNIDFGNTDFLAKNKSSDNCLSNFENGESEFLGFIEKAKNANVKYIAKQKKEATEAFVKSVLVSPSPAVMIFSTHGYYEEKPRPNAKNPLQSIKEPLLRTGIMLSDANLAWCGNQTSNDKEDELLTAYEISNMDLSNTQVVVLSACQSGVGDLQGSEGVYGLQRAFKMAGVKNVLCTLWSVDATVAQSFVDIFYKEILSGKTAHEAFVIAQNNLRKTSTPNLWGAFILVE